MTRWVDTAEQQNWNIRAAEYARQAALENIKQQNAGHFPTVSVQGTYNVAYNSTISDVGIGTVSNPSTVSTFPYAPPQVHTQNATVSLNLGVPIFQGGLVVAQTNQAKYNYQAAVQQLEQSVRGTINTTRQSYLGIISGIEQIHADKQAIKSTISSLHGLQAGYRVGTQTLVDVLNQQQKVFQAQTQYATDRYAYVNNLLSLKQAAGTLSQDDLQAINAWLLDRNSEENYSQLEHEMGIKRENEFMENKSSKKTYARKKSKQQTVAQTKTSDRLQIAKLDDVNLKLTQKLGIGKTDLSLSP
jgi:outer membrane protein